jgi:alpha-1,3-glucosyltransferase
MLPVLVRLWRRPHPHLVAPALSYCALTAFVFGWHVHEKAILVPLCTLALTALDTRSDTRIFLFATGVATYSLFPLLFNATEAPLKWLL